MVLLLNVRRKIKGHVLVSTGLMDQVLIHPRETFRAAVIASAHSVILMHNHPSGDSNPSEADIRVTRDLIRAGQVLKIEVLDHVIVGRENQRSLRELGYFSEGFGPGIGASSFLKTTQRTPRLPAAGW
ncbi:MAG: JAB domain-containing protein [Verrucomicrobiota bacterium]